MTTRISQPTMFVVLGDSLARPRVEDGLFEPDTYAFKLQGLLGPGFYVLNKALGGNHIVQENKDAQRIFHIQSTRATYFSIQIGIVDCTPRIFTEPEKQHLNTLSEKPLIGRWVKKWISSKSARRYEITRERQISQTELPEFDQAYRKLVENIRTLSPSKRIFAINIAYPGKLFIDRNYGVLENIKSFNAVIRQICSDNADIMELVDVHALTEKHNEYVLADGHHVSRAVHDWLAAQISSRVLTIEDHSVSGLQGLVKSEKGAV